MKGLTEILEKMAAKEAQYATVVEVRAAYDALNQVHAFKPGDLVMWKEGLRNKLSPLRGEPAIVLEVLESPLYDVNAPADSSAFLEPLDISLGVIKYEGDTGSLIVFHFDSRRFQPYDGNLARQIREEDKARRELEQNSQMVS